jgi:dihydropteroate synthase
VSDRPQPGATPPGKPARPIIVGILNVTPDSFSDGGRHDDLARALAHGLRMAEEGADIIDVGGESTRPGAMPVAAGLQISRTEPVIAALREQLPATIGISIDTRVAVVARRALDAGAGHINDVSAGSDPALLALAAERGVPIWLMHMQGEPASMQRQPHYADVVAEVLQFLLERAALARQAGVAAARIALDPGIGFGKTLAHNLALLRALDRLVATGYPVLLGTSRKRMLRELTGEQAPGQLAAATCATTALGVARGVRMFRVHDVKANRHAADVAWAIEGRPEEGPT